MKKWKFSTFIPVFLLMAACATGKNTVIEDPRINTLQKQVTALQTEIVDLKNLLAVRDLSINDLDLAIEQLQTSAKKVQSLDEQLALLQAQLADKSALIEKLGAKDPKLQALLDANAALKATLSDLAKQVANANQANLDLANRNQAAEAKLVLMTGNFDQSAKRIVLLESLVSNLKSQVAALTLLSEQEAKELDARVAVLSKLLAK